MRRSRYRLKRGRQIVLVHGEVGIGKTALAAQAALEAHAEGATVLYGRCDRHLIMPYDGIVEALPRYVSECPIEALPADLGPGGGTMALLVPALANRRPSLLRPDVGPEVSARHLLFGSITTLVASIASADAPVLLAIEDVHGGDDDRARTGDGQPTNPPRSAGPRGDRRPPPAPGGSGRRRRPGPRRRVRRQYVRKPVPDHRAGAAPRRAATLRRSDRLAGGRRHPDVGRRGRTPPGPAVERRSRRCAGTRR